MNLHHYQYLVKREKIVKEELELAKAKAKAQKLEQELLFLKKWKSDINENDEEIPDILLNPEFESIRNIQNIVCEVCGISLIQLLSKKKSKSLTKARHIAMYLARELTPYSLPEIGDAFAGRDHTTIMHGCRKIEELLLEDSDLEHLLTKIKTLLDYRRTQ